MTVMHEPVPSPGQFMARIPSLPSGNSPWAQQYGRELRECIERQAHRSPRNMQAHLGPSELGEVCDRQIVGKFSGQPVTNHVIDPWPSIVGVAVHAWLADALAKENNLDGILRWVTEYRVSPHPSYPGTADLYDAANLCVVDWKILGPTTIAKISSANGPPRRYVVQLLLYAKGYQNLGLPVNRVVLAALPRTAPSLSQMYVWEHWLTPADDILISQVLSQTQIRYQVAREVMAGGIPIESVPITPTADNCQFCPFYRPQVAREIREGRQQGPGCPGHSPLN
jgi:hypothetical protein